jgi:hypothetical protein
MLLWDRTDLRSARLLSCRAGLKLPLVPNNVVSGQSKGRCPTRPTRIPTLIQSETNLAHPNFVPLKNMCPYLLCTKGFSCHINNLISVVTSVPISFKFSKYRSVIGRYSSSLLTHNGSLCMANLYKTSQVLSEHVSHLP